MKLSPQEQCRYHRHLNLPEIGEEGQLRLKNASVLIAGAGGLGCPASLYLAAAGVGRIGIVDPDLVSLSNLQRQILYSSEELNSSKVAAAGKRLQKLNPEIQVDIFETQVTSQNVNELISNYQIVIDGTDNFSSRYLIHDACYFNRKPYLYGAVFRFDAQASLFSPSQGPCYRCLYPEPPQTEAVQNCQEAGVLGVLPGIIGTLQATEALKLILQIGTPLMGRLLVYDALQMSFQTFEFKKRKDCPLCGENPSILSLPAEVANPNSCPIEEDEGQLIDVRTSFEFRLGHLPNALHVPLEEIPFRLKELNPDQKIFIYCQSGTRSRRAIEILRSAGFQKLRHLEGGLRGLQTCSDLDPVSQHEHGGSESS